MRPQYAKAGTPGDGWPSASVILRNKATAFGLSSLSGREYTSSQPNSLASPSTNGRALRQCGHVSVQKK
jgi:hypothetical protein